MPQKLSEAVVKQRLQQLRNLQKAHVRDLEKISLLEALVAVHEATIAGQQQQLDTQAIQIAELQTMVFGKRCQPPTSTPGSRENLPPVAKPPRTKESYRRPLPPTGAITATEHFPAPVCACGGGLTNFTTQDRFVEDIPLPELTSGYRPKLVTRLVVERGVCDRCGKPRSGRNLGGAVTSLGPNIRLLVSHLVSVSSISYSQVATLCQTLYGLTLSDGEIAGIIKAQHQTWLPAYHQLRADIQASKVNYRGFPPAVSV